MAQTNKKSNKKTIFVLVIMGVLTIMAVQNFDRFVVIAGDNLIYGPAWANWYFILGLIFVGIIIILFFKFIYHQYLGK